MSARGDEQGHVIIGRISGLHGVRGGLKIYSYTRPKEQVFSYRPWLVGKGDSWLTLEVKNGQVHGKGLIAFIEGIEERDSAIPLVGQEIAIARGQLPPLPEGEYYWCDLIGLEVRDLAGKVLGKIVDLRETGANDVLVVQGEEQRIFIPLVMKEVVKEVDLAKGLMRVDWNPEFI